jgi:glycosyltransferase involved in cell wall biosynthesis
MSMPPVISVVVPNFNGAATLADTLASLVEQDYPHKEILVVDGGSTDASVHIIQRYAEHIAWWVSEKDNGQSSAINKGLARAKGQVVNWLCSDDRLEKGALRAVAETFAADENVDVVVGACRTIYTAEHRELIDRATPERIEHIPTATPFSQPSCFFHRSLLRTPALDESYHYALDLELWAYFKSRHVRWKIIDNVLSVYVMGGQNKTSTGGEKITREIERVYTTYVHERVPLTWWVRHFMYPMDRFRKRHPGAMADAAVRGLKGGLCVALAPFYGGFSRVRAMNWSAHG